MGFKFVNITKKIEKSTTYNILFRSITLSYYKKIVKREIRLGFISKEDNVLCIGGGYFPATAILIAKIVGCNVTVVDNDIETIKVAKVAINKCKINDKVNVEFIDGIEVNASKYDVVTIANQISPKNVVYNQIKNTIDSGRILVRKPKKHLLKGYDEEELLTTTSSIKQPFYSNIERTLLNVN